MAAAAANPSGDTASVRSSSGDSTSSNKSSSKKKAAPKKNVASISETLSFVRRCGVGTQVLFGVGTIGGIAHGLAWPALAYFLSRSYQTMSKVQSTSDPMHQIRHISFIFIGLGVYSLVTAFLQTFSFELVSRRASRLLQLEWFQALLRQDSAYYDVANVSGMAALVGPSTLLYTKGIGRKLGEGIQNMTTGVGGLIFGLYSTWRVSLLVFAVVPLLAGASYMAIQLNQSKTARASAHYQDAGRVAYTSISALRTVLSLNAMEEMIRQYHEATQKAFESATSVLVKLGFWNGMITGAFNSLFAVVILFGSYVMYRNVRSDGCDPGGGIGGNAGCSVTGADVFGAMLGILFAGQSSSQVGNASDAFQEARVAAYEALKVINRLPGKTPAETVYHEIEDGDADGKEDNEDEGTKKDISSKMEEGNANGTLTVPKNVKAILPAYEIDPFSKEGLKPENVEGKLTFENVAFSYPTRPADRILNRFNMEIPAGKTVALVGPSGGGKSTTMGLIERFYDPLEGSISLDGTNIKDLNLAHYRNLMGYVGQEPVLFSDTIANNIALGVKDGKVSQEQIESAAKMANAHDFIMSFPNGYHTNVGDKGSQLSGGQKQRIAIARILVSNPKILLLDEATSALDSESELIVQDALDNILEQRSLTTIIIAHRLSTIRNADIIYVVSGGTTVENGTHEELMQSEKGYYRQLVEKQEGPSQREQRQSLSTRSSFSASSDGGYSDVVAQGDNSKADRAGGSTPSQQVPQIEFQDVCFAYPARPTRTIFNNFNLSVLPGETVALVGPSGGGKSTTIALIERFYDPSQGTLNFMGNDVKSLNVRWYRDQIGYVSQEPTLFNTTIGKNIAYGYPEATQAEIEEAARNANAHDFIMSFPQGYDTNVGELGGQLSGGQKQRVAIARALVKKPKLLIFDEATSALDNESEAIVHQALSELMASRSHTTIVIAHKLSTVRDADRIAFIAHGKVKEIGSHEELLAKDHGHYKRLVDAQKRGSTLDSVTAAPTIEDAFKKAKEADSVKDEAEETPEKEKEDVFEDRAAQSFITRIRKMAAPDIGYLLAGSIGAIMSGASYPLMGLLFAASVDLFYYSVEDCSDNDVATLSQLGFDTCHQYWDHAANDMQSRSYFIALFYFLLVIDALVGGTVLVWGFGQASERLSQRFRDQTFMALMRQEVGYFDKRNIGDITSELQDNTARLHAFSGAPIRQFLEAVTALMTGIVLSFVFMWPFALVCVGCIPFMGFSSLLRRKAMVGEDEGDGAADAKLKSSGGIMVETLLNMRTVSALALEEKRFEAFQTAVQEAEKGALCECFSAGVVSGIGMFIQRFTNALLYFWGGYLLIHHPDQYGFHDFLIAQFAFLFSSFGLAAAFQDMDDRAEVEESAKAIFSILDRRSQIDPLSEEGKRLDSGRRANNAPAYPSGDSWAIEPEYTNMIEV